MLTRNVDVLTCSNISYGCTEPRALRLRWRLARKTGCGRQGICCNKPVNKGPICLSRSPKKEFATYKNQVETALHQCVANWGCKWQISTSDVRSRLDDHAFP